MERSLKSAASVLGEWTSRRMARSRSVSTLAMILLVVLLLDGQTKEISIAIPQPTARSAVLGRALHIGSFAVGLSNMAQILQD